ncbi:MAG: polysaccharide biosynthesis C-terminal domain-containing protein [Nanoarchaeota archaeon]|nr:polysaccharide biosynthesis C-terminal domain-containing protein [Nanoarchaeota archaeon]
MEDGKGVAYSMVLLATSKVVTYFLLLILANLFLKEVYGRAAFVMNIFTLVLFFSLVGVPYALVPWIVKKRDINSVFHFLMLVSIFCVIAGIIITWQHKWVMPLVFLFPILLVRGFSGAYLYSKYKQHLVVMADLIYIFFAFILIYLFRHFSKGGIIMGYAIAALIPSMILIFLTRKDLAPLFNKFKINFYIVRNYIGNAIITSLIYISFAFLDLLDSTIIGILSTFENVAMYNVAGPISNVISLIPVTFGLFLLAKSSEIIDRKHSRMILSKMMRVSFSLSFLSAIAVVSLSYWIVSIFFPKYIGIEPFIAILISGVVLYSAYNMICSYLLGRLMPRKALFAIGFAAILNIILDVLLVPKFGLWGVSIATFIAHLVAFTILVKKMGLFKSFYKIYLLILFIPLALYMEVYGLLLIVLLVPLLIFAGLLKKEDIYFARDIVKDIFKIKPKINL